MERADGTKVRRVDDPRLRVPYVVLGALLVLTGVGTTYVSMNVRAREALRFEAAAHRVEGRIRSRVEIYTALLRGADGLFASRWPVLPKEFTEYASRLDLRKNYPGVLGIGLAAAYRAGSPEQFDRMMRGILNDPTFRTWPADSNEDLRSSIIYLEPRDERNTRAVGFDMYSEATRQAAMRQARDTGQATASGRVILMQDQVKNDSTPGFLIYVPVYTGGVTPPTREGRRANFRGWVYSPFRAPDLFGDVLAQEMGSELRVRIYDRPEREDAHLLYATAGPWTPGREGMETSASVIVAGRPWMVLMAAGPGFTWWAAEYLPWAAGILGVGLSLSLFAVLRGQVMGRVRAERISSELRESRGALQRSEAKFRRLTDSNLVGVVFSRMEAGLIVEANDAFLRMVGYTREDVAAGRVTWPLLAAEEWRRADGRAVEQLMADGVCEAYETEYVRKDGARVPVMAGVARLEGAGGETVGFAVDLTEVKRAQRDMQEAKESAEAATRLKDEFLATVSHELRTPLNAILGWAQLLAAEEGLVGPEDVRQGIETILRNSRMQAQLIEDLLDVSRIVSGKLRLEARAVEIAGVVHAATASVGLAAEAKGVRIVDAVGATEAVVWGDPDRLQQVMWNLLSNSIKFTERGGEIRVDASVAEGHVTVSVTDTGAGVHPDFVPYVFERFRQGDATLTRKYGGLGLGLSIVRNLVEMHGGRVGVESAGVGKGSRFWVRLPVRAAGTGPRPGGVPRFAASGASSEAKSKSLEGMRVLVVDDDADARELVRKVLVQQRAEVVTAGTAARAIELLRTGRVGVLVSDLAMPEGDGFELIRAVRELPVQYGGNVPAVALSALVRAEERERALAAGYQIHLPKPVEAGKLVGVVAALGRR